MFPKQIYRERDKQIRSYWECWNGSIPVTLVLNCYLEKTAWFKIGADELTGDGQKWWATMLGSPHGRTLILENIG